MDDEIILTEIKRIKGNSIEKLTDKVINEISLEIWINEKKFISVAALPSNLKELATGFLFSEGLILNKNEIKKIIFKEPTYQINFNVEIPSDRLNLFYKTAEKTSGCGATISASINYKSVSNFKKMQLDRLKLSSILKDFQKSSHLFFQTGGVHSAAIVKDYQIVFYAEDIGRHNAVDKVIGKAILSDTDLKDSILLSSGRISSEIVKKTARLKIPMIVSQSATTYEAINLAWKYKVYLIGFARFERFNIYTGFDNLSII